MADNRLGNYVEVKDRIAEFRTKHPEGSLQPINPSQPYSLECIQTGDKHLCFIVYTAACYRTPDDPRPGIGTAWEPFPGLTNFTRNSELMNAETSAWGRAIVAALAADANSIATKEDVQNRAAEAGIEQMPSEPMATKAQVKCMHTLANKLSWDSKKLHEAVQAKYGRDIDALTKAQASHIIDGLAAAAEKEEKNDA